MFAPYISNLRQVLSIIRLSKVKRNMYRELSRTLTSQARESPRLDVVTRWNSTHLMMKSAFESRSIIDLMMHNDDIKSDFAEVVVTPAAWMELGDISKFLEVPAWISTFLGADRGYCTISRAIAANKLLVDHCRRHLGNENPLLSKATKKILHYNDYSAFIDYLLESPSSLIREFVLPPLTLLSGVKSRVK